MDQKRTLWIVGSVGLFLIVVVGFALIIYAPERKAKPSETMMNKEMVSSNDIWSSTQSSDFIPVYPERTVEASPEAPTTQGLPSDSMELVGQSPINSDSAQNTQNVQNLTVISENTKVVTNGQTIDLTGILNTTSQPTVVQSSPVARVPSSSVSSSNASSNYKTQNQVQTSTKTESAKVASTKPATQTTTIAKKTASSSSASSTSSVPRYWIQVSSYSSKKNAEEARNCLSGEKISSEIFTFTDAKGNLFYRVRVGPYSTKSEAEYWRTKISAIDTFKNTSSYVTSTKVEQ